MKALKQLAAALLVCAVGMGLASQANAVPLAIDDSHYLGSIIRGVPASDANEFSWVNTLAAMAPGTSITVGSDPQENELTRSGNTLLFPDMPTAPYYLREDSGMTDWTVGSSSLYLLAKYGRGPNDTQASHVWFLGNIPVGTTVTLPSPALSHSTMFFGERTSVPDGGATVMLLGAAFAGLGVARRFIKR
jgi:hypothetical protein